MKLTILNLPRNFTEDQLAKLFKHYGHIKACTLVLDAQKGTSKGFGFVEMALEHEGVQAVAALNGSTVGDRKIRVKLVN